jgi:outer membrane protein OmpA-like peptidoglycan-associated protein
VAPAPAKVTQAKPAPTPVAPAPVKVTQAKPVTTAVAPAPAKVTQAKTIVTNQPIVTAANLISTPQTSQPAPKPVSTVVDVRKLVFTRLITGFGYKKWTVEESAVSNSIKTVMKVVLPLIQKILEQPNASKYKVYVIGHTDGIGPEQPIPDKDKPGNIAISRMRAEAVLEYLVQNYGLPRDLFIIVPKGASELFDKVYVASPQNRRVTITFKP